MKFMGVRLMEIDALRGVAIVGMVIFHGVYDLIILDVLSIEPYAWPQIIVVRAVQFLFLGLVGVSIHLSSRGAKAQLRRGLTIFSCGLLVSLATWLTFPDQYVRFGVLHFIGVSIPIVALFKNHKAWAVFAALVCILLGSLVSGVKVEVPWLFPIGLTTVNFSSFDYFPLFPWLAVPLLGLVVGEIVYSKHKPTRLAVLAKVPGLTAMGRHSLAIYLLHQPVLYFTLWGLSAALT